ncbi:unnamed protein product [Gadus morhua 'NCC']
MLEHTTPPPVERWETGLMSEREMMKFAWDNYKRYAWGKNELRPLTRNGHVGNMFGGLRGASIIDSLDTLYIMGLTEEYNDAKEWVKNSLDMNTVREQPRTSPSQVLVM